MSRRKNNQTRQQILNYAFNKFIEKGYDKVSMREVATNCNISTPLLQHYFYSKEDILVHIIYSILSAVFTFIHDHYSDTLETLSSDDAVILNEILFYKFLYNAYGRNNNQLLKLYMNVLERAHLIKAGIDFTEETTDALFVPIETEFQREIRQRIDYIYCGVMTSSVQMYLSGKRNSLKAIVDDALDIALYSIKLSMKKRKELLDYSNKLINSEAEDLNYQYVLSSLENFGDCNW